MSGSWRQELPEALQVFVEEVLRWNRQINLISRQDSENLLRALMEQCRGGVAALGPYLHAVVGTQAGAGVAAGSASHQGKPPLHYFDLGSGGGLPGFIWHHDLNGQGWKPASCLVEPREKRAWFLRQVVSRLSLEGLEIDQARWGEGGVANPDSAFSGAVLVSLKALHLTDAEVLDGLVHRFGGSFPALSDRRLVIARYYPSDQVLDRDLARRLAFPSGRQVAIGKGLRARDHESTILRWAEPGSRSACLVVSSYGLKMA